MNNIDVLKIYLIGDSDFTDTDYACFLEENRLDPYAKHDDDDRKEIIETALDVLLVIKDFPQNINNKAIGDRIDLYRKELKIIEEENEKESNAMGYLFYNQ